MSGKCKMAGVTVIFRDCDTSDTSYMFAVHVQNSMETLNFANRPVSWSDQFTNCHSAVYIILLITPIYTCWYKYFF